MKRRFLGNILALSAGLLSSTLLWAQSTSSESYSPVDLVNPLTGTLSSFELSTGNTYPVISRPWGMNSWTPQTGKMGDGWQYTYTAGKIRGFKQTHQPSPWINDYGQFSLMPMTGDRPIFDQEQRASWFGHKAELARPHYYKVYLADYDTEVELTPSERAAVLRIEYSETSKSHERWLVVDAFDAGSHIERVGTHRLAGFSRKNSGGVPENFKNYFVLEFDAPIAEYVVGDSLGKQGRHAMIGVRFEGEGRMREVRVASSFVSEEQAWVNLREVQGKSFDELKQEGREVWHTVLSRLMVRHPEADKVRTFYSNLYRCLLFPRRFYEITAEQDTIHYSPYNGRIERGYMYTDTGLWDTFRALFPLINLVYPEEGARMQEGMLAAYRESGFFPEWASPGHRDCMVGNNSASVVTDALLKGLGRVNARELIEGLIHGSEQVHPSVSSTGRLGHEYYNRLGYIPCDVGIRESAARSLEYAYADWCILQALRHTGASKKLQRVYAERAKSYRNLFDKQSGWMRGRNQDGSFQSPFSPFKWGDAFTEGNALHYTWSVFHDVAGLVDLMGGERAFERQLDTIFSLPPLFDHSYYGFTIHEIREMQIMNMGNYAHGNQPIQHMIYLYNYVGATHKAQQRIRQVMDRFYSHQADGYCGDEDNGQTSAWYVFSALGFYPVTPASDQYVIGSPYFEEVQMNLPSGKTTLYAPRASKQYYIRGMRVNGQPYEKVYLRYRDLKAGAKVEFDLDTRPSSWGQKAEGRPYSFSREGKR